MARAREIAGTRILSNQFADRRGAVVRRDPGGRAAVGIDRDRERRAVASGVRVDHRRQLELVEPLALDRYTDQAAGVGCHEVDCFRRDGIGRHRQIALVLAVLVVDDDDHAAALERPDGPLYRAGWQRPRAPSGRPARAVLAICCHVQRRPVRGLDGFDGLDLFAPSYGRRYASAICRMYLAVMSTSTFTTSPRPFSPKVVIFLV